MPAFDDSFLVPGRMMLCSHSSDQTEQLGYLLASLLPAGTVIRLDGDLGAGKTALTRGLAAGLGRGGMVASPTFTLVMEHPARPGGLALYHFDFYRLEQAEDFLDLGLDEYFDRGGICVLEWASRVADALPADALQIILRQIDGQQPDLRQIEISWPEQPQIIASLACLWAAGLEENTGRKSFDADPGL